MPIMDATRRFFYGPTPEEQRRKFRTMFRQNERKLDRDLANLKTLESKTKSYILQASKRAQRNPSQATQAAQETRLFARELIRVRKQEQRLTTSKATLASVASQVDQTFGMRKVESSLKTSTSIMKDVNTLVRLPELTGAMRELSAELMKAGIIEEMVSDTLDAGVEMDAEDEEVETEVDKVLGEVLKDRVQNPAAQIPTAPIHATPSEEEADEVSEEMLSQMRGRLEALKN